MLIVLIVNRHWIRETDAGIGFNKGLYIYRIWYIGHLIGLQLDEIIECCVDNRIAAIDEVFRIILR